MSAKRINGLSAFFAAEIATKYADLLLMGCCLSSGLVDSTLYNAYGTFVSMQTGNTIFLGLGASNQNLKPYGWARSLTSISTFVIGCWLFAHLNRRLGARRRGTLILSFLIQSFLIAVTVGLVAGGIVPGLTHASEDEEDPGWAQQAPIVLLSLQSSGQIVASRALGYNEVPTVVITSLLCDLVSDPRLWFKRNEKRNRRIVAFCLTLCGAIAGGWITKATGDIHIALCIAGGLKLTIAAFWGLWAATKPVSGSDSEDGGVLVLPKI